MFELGLSQSPGGCFHITTRTYLYYWFDSLVVGSPQTKFGRSICIHSGPSGGSFQHYTHLLLDCFLNMSTGRHQPGSAPHRQRRRALLACTSRLQFQKENRDKSSSAADRRTLMWTSSSTDAGCCSISITISLSLSHVNFGHCLLMHFTVDAKKLLPRLELLFFLASESQHSSEPHLNLSPMKQVLKLGHSGTS